MLRCHVQRAARPREPRHGVGVGALAREIFRVAVGRRLALDCLRQRLVGLLEQLPRHDHISVGAVSPVRDRHRRSGRAARARVAPHEPARCFCARADALVARHAAELAQFQRVELLDLDPLGRHALDVLVPREPVLHDPLQGGPEIPLPGWMLDVVKLGVRLGIGPGREVDDGRPHHRVRFAGLALYVGHRELERRRDELEGVAHKVRHVLREALVRHIERAIAEVVEGLALAPARPLLRLPQHEHLALALAAAVVGRGRIGRPVVERGALGVAARAPRDLDLRTRPRILMYDAGR
mmetsp:Transcript_108093/g.314406  ORF Transcript_108093/g.314406 Transcript_108093/m.314406 type:complete len:296 (-) Transcript_108093:388-1275(-)